MTSESLNGQSIPLELSPSRQYIYDAQGNRLSILENSNEIFNATYDNRERPLTSNRNGLFKTYFYSDDDTFIIKAEPHNNKQQELRYSLLNQLLSVTFKENNATTKTISYLIDGEKKRVGKLVNGTPVAYYVYDKYGRLLAEIDPMASVKCRFVYASQSHSPDYMLYSSGVEQNIKMFFVKDHLGSILKVVDPNGLTRQAIEYDEFGLVLSDSNPGFQPLGFAGGHYEPETGLVRFGFRDYDADIGKWTQADPIEFKGGDANLYTYVSNDPINEFDSTGLSVGIKDYEGEGGLSPGGRDIGAGTSSGGGGGAATTIRSSTVYVSPNGQAVMAPSGSRVSNARGNGMRISTPDGTQYRLMGPNQISPNGYGKINVSGRFMDSYGNLLPQGAANSPLSHIQPTAPWKGK